MWFITNIVSVSSIKHKAANKLLSSGLMADMGGLVVGSGSGGGFGGIKSLSSSSSSEKIIPRTEGQRLYLNALQNKNTSILIGLGPAGTGKTMFSCQTAIDGILAGTYQKIVLTRPVVSVEEDIGFLPGSLVQKMDPWTRPLFDIFLERFSKAKLNSMIQNGVIEISPLGYMRGRTFKNTFVIADEMQNSSPMQMKMITTRIGEGSKMVITGDLNQSDRCEKNGLVDLVERLRRVSMKKAVAAAVAMAAAADGGGGGGGVDGVDGVDGGVGVGVGASLDNQLIRLVELSNSDIQRSLVVKEVLEMYDDLKVGGDGGVGGGVGGVVSPTGNLGGVGGKGRDVISVSENLRSYGDAAMIPKSQYRPL